MKTNIKKLTQKGFSHFELALVIVIIAAISAVGFYVFNAKNNKSKADTVTPITNQLVHGSYVSIDSCVQGYDKYVTYYRPGNYQDFYIFTNVMLTDEKYYDKQNNKPMVVLDEKKGEFTGRAKPESYKVIVGALNSGIKSSTKGSEWWFPAYKYTNNHGRQQLVLVGPLKKNKPSYEQQGTVRYYILFHNKLVYTKDVPLNQISYCNKQPFNYTSYTSYFTSF